RSGTRRAAQTTLVRRHLTCIRYITIDAEYRLSPRTLATSGARWQFGPGISPYLPVGARVPAKLVPELPQLGVLVDAEALDVRHLREILQVFRGNRLAKAC